MKKIIASALLTLAAGVSLAVSPSANAEPVFGCSPCVSVPGVPAWEQVWPGPGNTGPWEKAFSSGPWEKAFGGGSWEKATSGGSWEKAFQNAPMP